MDRDRDVGSVKCNQCNAHYTVKIHSLSEPIDVYRRAATPRGPPELAGSRRGAACVAPPLPGRPDLTRPDLARLQRVD